MNFPQFLRDITSFTLKQIQLVGPIWSEQTIIWHYFKTCGLFELNGVIMKPLALKSLLLVQIITPSWETRLK